MVLVIQSTAQLREVYGPNHAETMLKSLAARIVFAPKDQADAREISEELGYTTVRVQSRSRPRMAGFEMRKSAARGSISESEHRRALMLPQEVKELGGDRAIVFYEGLRPILCKRIRYFEDRVFQARLLPAPANPAPLHQEGAAKTLEPGLPPNIVAPFATPKRTAPGTRMRTATTEDLDRLDQLEFEDFAVAQLSFNWTGDARPSDKDLQLAVDEFLKSLQ